MSGAQMMMQGRKPAPAGGSSTITDSFDRAASTTTLGSTDTGDAWTPLAGTWGITAAGKAYTPASTSQAVAVVTSTLSDCEIQAKLTNPGGTHSVGLVGRATDNNNYWLVAAGSSSGRYELYRRETGTFTSIGWSSVADVDGDVLQLRFTGTTIEVLVNGVVYVSTTSSFNQTATKHGIRAHSTTVGALDDFSIVSYP